MEKTIIQKYKASEYVKPEGLEHYLNEKAKDGWEVLTVIPQQVPVKPPSNLALPNNKTVFATMYLPIFKRYEKKKD